MASFRRVAAIGGGCGCLVLAAGAVGLVASGGLAGVLLVGAASRWEEGLRTALDQATGGEVSFATLRLSWSGLTVSDVRVMAEDGEPFVVLDSVWLGASDLETLRTDTWQLTRVEVDGVTMSARRLGDGWALPRRTLAWLSADNAGGVPFPSIEVPDVRIRSVTLSVPVEPGGPAVELGAEQLKLSGVSARPTPTGPALRFTTVAGDGAALRTSGLEGRLEHFSAESAGPVALDAWGRLAALTGAGVDAKIGTTAVRAASLDAAGLDLATFDLGATEVHDVALVLGADTVRVDRISVDPGPPAERGLEAAVALGSVDAPLSGWESVGRALADLDAVEGLGLDTLSAPTVRAASVRIGGSTLHDVGVGGVVVAEGGVQYGDLEAARAEVGPITVQALTLDGGQYAGGSGFVISGARAAGASLVLDLYAPHLGLGGLVGAMPSGTSFATLTLADTTVAVAAGARSGAAKIGSVTLADATPTADGWTASDAVVTDVTGTLRSASGTLEASLARAELRSPALAAHTTVASGALTTVSVDAGGDRVARADRLGLGSDGGVTVARGELWTALVGPHALSFPALVTEHVPAGIGGAGTVGGPWWGIALGDLPWVPARITGAGTVHLRDTVLADKTFAFEASAFSLGPFGGSSVPLSANGTVAGGRFEVTGTASSDGQVSVTVKGRGLDAVEFEPYGTPLLGVAGLGVGPGRVALDLELGLTTRRLTVAGDVGVKNLTLVVRDKKKAGAALLTALRGGRLDIDDRHVPIDVGCGLDAEACSPIEELAAAVTSDLIAAASGGLTEGVEALIPGPGKGSRSGKGGKAGKAR